MQAKAELAAQAQEAQSGLQQELEQLQASRTSYISFRSLCSINMRICSLLLCVSA